MMEMMATAAVNHRAKKINRTPEDQQRRRSRKVIAATLAAGIGIGAGTAAWLKSGNGDQIARQGRITKAEVFRVTPESIDTRARTSVDIQADAHFGLNLHVPRPASHVPFIGSTIGKVESVFDLAFKPFNHSFRFDSQFR